MRLALLALALLGLAATLPADETKAPLARVRLSGELAGVSTATGGGKTTSKATLTTPGQLKVEVSSADPLSPVYVKASKAKLALIKEQLEATRKLLGDEKLVGAARQKALDKLKAEYKARERSLVVAEGTLTAADGKVRLNGSARLADADKEDRDLPVGGAMVEGEAEAGKFALGKDGEAALAIKNGSAPIYVTGKEVGDETRKGKLRVYGHLRQGEKGALVLEATKVEEVK